MSWLAIANTTGVLALAVTVVLHLLGKVNNVPVVLATLGLVSIWMTRLERILGERQFLYPKVKITWDREVYTFRIGNNVTEMTRREIRRLIKEIEASLQSDVGSGER